LGGKKRNSDQRESHVAGAASESSSKKKKQKKKKTSTARGQNVARVINLGWKNEKGAQNILSKPLEGGNVSLERTNSQKGEWGVGGKERKSKKTCSSGSKERVGNRRGGPKDQSSATETACQQGLERQGGGAASV